MPDCIAKGIDISSWQGDVNFHKVKAAGYSFVIIKAGQGLKEMQTFKGKYLPGVLEAGLDWGAYWWSDAVTTDGARREAVAFAEALKGLQPTYPVWMDQEYAAPCGIDWGAAYNKQLRTDMVKAFLNILQVAGYYAGLYASTDWLLNWVYDDQLTAYDKWAAQYASRCTYPGKYGMWQHHGDAPGFVGQCDGISGAVDLNDCYKDYPGIIKAAGLNNWPKTGSPGSLPAEPKPDYEALYKGLIAELSELINTYKT